MADRYIAEVSGATLKGRTAAFSTIAAARKWGEDYGTTADRIAITNMQGKPVAEFRRDTNGNGLNWFRAAR